LKLELVAHTPHVETVIATAMLTTMRGARPSAIFRGLLRKPGRVAGIVGGLEVQHGSILEHNRLCWLLEAGDGEVLDILLRCRFFSFTRLGGSKWLVSANLRTVVEFAGNRRGAFADALVESIREIAPTVYGRLRRDRR